jgi:hypothetical protein
MDESIKAKHEDVKDKLKQFKENRTGLFPKLYENYMSSYSSINDGRFNAAANRLYYFFFHYMWIFRNIRYKHVYFQSKKEYITQRDGTRILKSRHKMMQEFVENDPNLPRNVKPLYEILLDQRMTADYNESLVEEVIINRCFNDLVDAMPKMLDCLGVKR